MKNVVLFSLFLLFPSVTPMLYAEDSADGSVNSAASSAAAPDEKTAETPAAAPSAVPAETPAPVSAAAPEPVPAATTETPASTDNASPETTVPASSPSNDDSSAKDATKTSSELEKTEKNSASSPVSAGIEQPELSEKDSLKDNASEQKEEKSTDSSKGAIANKTSEENNLAKDNSAGNNSVSAAKAPDTKKGKPAAAAAKTAAKTDSKNSETKKETEKTKPRKYTDDRWVLKISSESIKEAVEDKPAIRGVHITAWVAGSTPLRTQIINNIKKTVLNTVVIALKEMDGAVYIKGVEKAEKYKAYAGAIPNPEKMVEDFKKEGLYTVGRIVLFKDDILPVRRPDLSVKTPEGNIWRDRKGKTWADQYSKEVWDYNIAVALRAVEAGFDEIQFDYIRYPSEGKVSLCRYSVPHNWDKARANLAEFLRYAREKIPEQIRISADVFGLTTSARDDMGIGQNLPLIAQYADYVYPMMYPSHYYPGHYGLKNPNAEPYKVINFGLRDAMARLELNYAKLRPYLQDFSKYGPHEVGEQIRALRKNLLHSWVLWSPNNKYTWSALYPEYYKKNIDPSYVPDK